MLDFTPQQQKALLAIVASVLHLGNLKFEDEDGGPAIVSNVEVVSNIAEVITYQITRTEKHVHIKEYHLYA